MNQPPTGTISLAQLVEAMRRNVMVRNEGVAPDERYAADDPTWTVPDGTLPADIEIEEPLGFEDVIGDTDEVEENG